MKKITLVLTAILMTICYSAFAQGEVINYICPVMKGKVYKDTLFKVEYEGKTVGFCCAGCVEQFKAKPKEYMKRLERKKQILSGKLEDGMRVVKVEAFKYGFRPKLIVVRVGEKVKLELKSLDSTHGLRIDDLDVDVIAVAEKSDSIKFIADKEGEFSFRCNVYCGLGHKKMQGKLKVVR